MPKVRRQDLPEALLRHLVRRVRERGVSEDQLIDLARWLDSEPTVPAGKWFRRFPGFIICGEGDLIKTFLVPGQIPDGIKVR